MSTVKIRSEVTGSVWKLLKQPGDTLTAGEEIMLIESMKMEIPVICEAGGRLAELQVAEGDAIQEGQIVATMQVG